MSKAGFRGDGNAGGSSSSGSGGGGGNKFGGLTKYQQQLKGKQGQSSVRVQGQDTNNKFRSKSSAEKAQIRADGDAIDSKFGFDRLKAVGQN